MSAAVANLPLSCVALNCQGLIGQHRRQQLFSKLEAGPWDLVVLVDTHCKDAAMARAWTQQGAGPGRPWPGQAFWSFSTSSHSGGVAVLIRDTAFVQSAEQQYDSGGRLLRVRLQLSGGQHASVVAVYAPALAELRPHFFELQLPAALQAPAHDMLLIAGDFNVVLDPFDRRGSSAVQLSEPGAVQLEAAMVSAGVQDAFRYLHPQQQQYTFFPYQSGHAPARLDRWLVSEAHLSWVSGAAIMGLGTLPGDHAPVSLHLQPPGTPLQGRGSWSFPVMLLNNDSYKQSCRQHIQASFDASSGAPPLHIWERLKADVRRHAVQFVRTQRQQQRRHHPVQQATRAMERAHEAYLADTHSQLLRDQWQQAVDHLRVVQQQHSSLEGLASSIAWHHAGEQGTLAFHKLGKQRPGPNLIHQLRDPAVPEGQAGTFVSLNTEVGSKRAGDLLADYFDGGNSSGLYAQRHVDVQQQDSFLADITATLSAQQQQQCEGPTGDGSLTAAELHDALATCKHGTSPGSDGLPYEFYKEFWAELSQPLVTAFNAVFSDAGGGQLQLTHSQRTGHLVLLYKGKGLPATALNSYRPITLLNCDLKLVAKALVIRWSPVLSNVIDPCQSAFLPGRWIGDNVLFHLELMDYLDRVDVPGVAIFLDFAQAYDRVHRGWLLRSMEALGCTPSMLRWVGVMFGGTQGVVRFNGFVSRPFPILSGVPQGSPLSPLLYLIAVQPLAARLRKLQQQGVIPAVLLPDGSPAPPCFQHADDTVVHSATISGAAAAIRLAIEPFCRASGAELSKPKSRGLVLGSHGPLPDGQLEPITGVPFVHTQRHLGILLSPSNPQAARQQLYSSIRSRISSSSRVWGRHPLSLLGRVHVAKQVLASKLYFAATFIPPPAAELHNISAIVSAFVRGAGDAGGPVRRCQPAAAIAALPQQQGGISMADIQAQILALQAKVAVHLFHPDPQHWKQLMRHAVCQASPQWGLAALLSAGPISRQLPFRVKGIWTALRTALPSQQLPPAPSNWSMSTCGQVVRFLPVPAAQQHLHPLAQQQHRSAPPQQQQPIPAAVVQLFGVDAQDRLQPLSATAVTPTGPWQPCEVVLAPAAKHSCPSLAASAIPTAVGLGPVSAYVERHQHPLLGSLASWHFGTVPFLFYTVRLGAQRIIHTKAQAGQPLRYVVGVGIRPKLWPVDASVAQSLQRHPPHQAGQQQQQQEQQQQQQLQQQCRLPLAAQSLTEAPQGLAAMETAWQTSFQVLLGSGAGAGPSRRRPREEREFAVGYGESSLAPAAPRLHPAVRAAARQQQAAAVASHFAPSTAQWRPLATSDPLQPVLSAPATSPQHAWLAAWSRLCDRHLPRHLRAFGWRMLHGALTCGAVRMGFQQLPRVQAFEQAQCPAAGCHQQLHTYTHMFLGCPLVKPAVEWLQRLWSRLEPGSPVPPSTAAVWLLDDHRVWSPADHRLQPLWTLLRLSLLFHIWAATSARQLTGGQPFDAVSIVASTCATVERLIQGDWLCCTYDVRMLLPKGSLWFRGRDPALTEAAFRQRWCRGGVLATVYAGHMRVRLSIGSVPGWSASAGASGAAGVEMLESHGFPPPSPLHGILGEEEGMEVED